MSNIPNWAESIRTGNFEQAEQNLSEAAAQRIIPQIQEAYVQDQVGRQIQQIDKDAGKLAPYVRQRATELVGAAVQKGAVKTPEDFVTVYRQSVSQGLDELKQDIRSSGYERDGYNPYSVSDGDIHDYIAMRRGQQQHLKDEGARLRINPANLNNGR